MQVYNQSDLLELFDLPCAACESHSVRDQLRKLGWSPDTTDAQLLAALPADPQQQHACRMHLLGLAASSDDWHTGMDSAFARHTARVFHKEVRASPRPMEGSALAAFEAGDLELHLPRLFCSCGRAGSTAACALLVWCRPPSARRP